MRGQRGVTLIEIMIGVAIAGIIGAVAFRLLSSTQQMSAMIQARSDAERQALFMMNRIARFYMSKKPGGIIAAKAATDNVLFMDYACNKCLPPASKPAGYSFSLHHDTEGCEVNNFPSRMFNCKGLSVARGMWTVNDPACGCAGERRADVYTVLSKCQKITTPTLKNVSFVSKEAARPKALAECTVCPPGERPVVIENHYKPNIDAGSGRKWRIFPDGNLDRVSGDGVTGNSAVKGRAADLQALTSSALGMEVCTHIQGTTVMVDVNAFYLQRASETDQSGNPTMIVRKVKQQMSFPRDVITNQDLRYLEPEK